MLNEKDAIRIDKYKTRSGRMITCYIFKCHSCDKTLRIQKSTFKTHKGGCTVCSQRVRPYEIIYRSLVKTAKEKKISIDLTYEQFLQVIKFKNCNYCGITLKWSKFSTDNKGNKLSLAYQLDRRDNNQGYTLNNVVPCCKTCNFLKLNYMNDFQFIEHCSKIAEYNN